MNREEIGELAAGYALGGLERLRTILGERAGAR